MSLARAATLLPASIESMIVGETKSAMVTASPVTSAMYSLLPVLLLALIAPAHAGVYKCANDKGGVIYQDTACAPGKELRELEIDPSTVPVAPGTAPANKGTPASAAKPSRQQSGTVTGSPGGGAAERKFLRVGMSETEVIEKVGRPDVESRRAQGARRWTYLPTDGDPNTLTTVTLVGDKVANVERKVMR